MESAEPGTQPKYEKNPASERGRDALASIRVSAQYLPQPLRGELEFVVSFLNDVEQVAELILERSPRLVGATVLKHARVHTGAYLRGEDPPALDSSIAELREARADLFKMIEEDIERQEQAHDEEP